MARLPLALPSALVFFLLQTAALPFLPDRPLLTIPVCLIVWALLGTLYVRIWCWRLRPAERRVLAPFLIVFVFLGCSLIEKGGAWVDLRWWLWIPATMGAWVETRRSS